MAITRVYAKPGCNPVLQVFNSYLGNHLQYNPPVYVYSPYYPHLTL